MLNKITVEKFEPLVGQEFRIQFTPETSLPARLISANKLGGDTELERTPFSLVFQTTQKNEYYQQSIFVISHESVGELQLFLVPIGQDKEGMKYEAIFS